LGLDNNKSNIFEFSLKKETLFLYFLIAAIFLFVLIWIAAWWTDKADIMLLEHYGYNYYGMSDIEQYGNVKAENLEEVKQIEKGMFGIGWNLKAIFACVITFPYIIIVYICRILIDKLKK
jgi:hypothetical protein